MSKILVTGAYGQLGSEIQFLSKNYLDQFLFASKATLDISNKKELENFLKGNHIDFIINCAAYTNVEQCETNHNEANLINHIAIKNIAEIAKKNKIALIHISTDYVFNGKASLPYKETDKPDPVNKYGQSKLLGEQSVLDINPSNSIIIRTSWLYSSYGNNFVKTIIRYAQQKNKIEVVSDQIGSPTYARDLATIILKIIPQLNNKNTEIYHYSNQGSTSWYDFAQEILELKKITCTLKPIKLANYQTVAKKPMFSVLNVEKIKNQFNLKIPTWNRSLKQCTQNLD